MEKYTKLLKNNNILVSEFSEKEKDEIVQLYRNAEKMTEKDWYKIEKNCSSNVKKAILMNKHSPQSVREKILMETENLLVAACIKYPIKQEVFERLFDRFKSSFYYDVVCHHMPFQKAYADYDLDKQLCQENINMIAKCIVEGNKELGDSHFGVVLSFSTDTENLIHFIKTSPILTEFMYKEVLSNKNIPDDIRNKIVNEEIEVSNNIHCDIQEIKNPTKEMAEQLYISAVSVIYEINNPPQDKVYVAEDCLTRLAREKELTEDLKVDLIKRMISSGSTKTRSFTEFLIGDINDPEVLREATKIKGVDKSNVYYNKNTPNDIIYDKALSILKKIKKGSLSRSDRAIFNNFISSRTLSEREYKYISDNLIPENQEIIKKLCRSHKTPSGILQNILNSYKDGKIDMQKQSDNILMAKLQLKMMENDFPEEYRKTVSYIAGFPKILEEETMQKFVDEIQTGNRYFLHNIFRPENKKFAPYVKRFLEMVEELKNKEDNPVLLNKMQSILKINQLIEEAEKQNSTERIEDKTDAYLIGREKELSSKMVSPNEDMLRLYLTVDNYIDEYNEIIKEQEKRNQEKLKEKEEVDKNGEI